MKDDRETIVASCERWVKEHEGESLCLAYQSIVDTLEVLKEDEKKMQPIIFCRDCKYRYTHDCIPEEAGYKNIPDDWLCANGVKKDD